MKEGQDIDCVGPFGHFYLRETKATMVCVAGGSGMAPIKSILWELYEKGERDREVWYFFGARTRRDLFFDKELEDLASKMPNFHFIPALSHPNPEDNWTGESGVITAILDKYIKNSIQGDPSTFEGYLCGSAGMLDACVKVLKENRMEEDKIYYDKF
jgi:Na+-transporting NADH:ubiquinone oxidoreductase subunit F